MKSNFLAELKELYYVKNSTFRFNAGTKDNLSFVQRLKLTDCHRVHRGCVNTISWDDSGSYILSGSDDLRLVVLDPFNGKVALSYKTKHPTNIFCAKFLPQSQNEQVVSSSAAGHIFHTYFDREDKGVSSGFNCHTGAAYELATIPNDPFVFMSCGEDRTIRWFDLRVKSSCNKEECSEDILVNCSRPIMSMSLRPTRPFEFAAGCSDSTVRIFDRRFISPANNGRTLKESCLLKFTCPQLNNQHHRITSLLYSADGTELLVSYSSEHLYLFDFKKDGRRFKSLLKTPLKNEPAPSETSLVLGSDSFKASLPSSPQSSSSSSSSPPPEPAQTKGKTVHGNPFIAGVSKQLPIKRLRLRGDWSDTGPQARPKRERPTGEQSSGVASVMERMSNLMTRWLERNLVRDSNDDNDASANNEAADMEIDNHDDDEDDSDDGNQDAGNNNDDNDGTEEDVGRNVAAGSAAASSAGMSQEASDALQNNAPGCSTSASVQEEPIIKVVQRRRNLQIHGDFGQTSSRSAESASDENIDDEDDNDLSGRRRVGASNEDRDGDALENMSQSGSLLEGGSRNQQQNTASTAGPSGPAIFISPASSASNIRDKAAKTIQAFFSNRFKGRDDKLCGENRDSDVVADRSDDDDDDDDSQRHDASLYRPAVTKCYKGHRNSRTLIKKASFWGSKYVMSGSDCGHIFVWDKDTTELVMFLEGDNHVVNCLQPHPTLPVLASSGIDYDVKIWMPVSEYPAFNQKEAYQVMNRNEVMLEETKGTVTVPAEFMFRLFSSLGRIRRGNRLQSSRNNSSLD